MNNKVDDYVDSLQPGDMVQYDGTLHAIVKTTPHDCYINIEGEIEKVSWSDIAEEYELNVLEEEQDNLQNNFNRND